MKLTTDDIYDVLLDNIDWWKVQHVSPPTGIIESDPESVIVPATMLYFMTKSGKWASYHSSGLLDAEQTPNIDDYLKNYLLWEAARQLFNGQCTGEITNIEPAGYQIFPEFFH